MLYTVLALRERLRAERCPPLEVSTFIDSCASVKNKRKVQEAALYRVLLRNASSSETSACSRVVFLRLCTASIRRYVGWTLDGNCHRTFLKNECRTKQSSNRDTGFLRNEWLWGSCVTVRIFITSSVPGIGNTLKRNKMK